MTARITQVPVEVVQDADPRARVLRMPVHEAHDSSSQKVRIAQIPVHVAYKSQSQRLRTLQLPVHIAEDHPPAGVTPPLEVLPYLIIPRGQGQQVSELDGHSSIPSFNFETIDLRGELKDLAAHTDIVGKLGRFRMGFPGMALEDFVTLHTTQLTSVGRIAEGRMSFESRELLAFATGEIWTHGGPHSAPGLTDPPAPPLFEGFAANAYPTTDKNPRYLYGNPIDILLVAYQNELGIGQATADPAGWSLYVPGNDGTLINPNAYLDVDAFLALRDSDYSGDHFEFKLTQSAAGKQWVDDQILKVLGLYTIIRPDGKLAPKSMVPPLVITPVPVTRDDIIGIPEVAREPVVNVVAVRMNVKDDRRETAGREYQIEYTFQERTSIERYKQQYKSSIESNGLRANYGGYGRALLLAKRVFRRHAWATPKYSITAHLKHIDLELGDFISLTHSLVLDYATGRLGLTNVVCEIVNKQPNYAAGLVDFEALDTRFMAMPTAWYIVDDALELPLWGDCTEEQRNSWMFISDANGLYSDGSAGRTIF